MDDNNPYQSSNAEPKPLERSKPFLLKLLLVVLSTSIGCGLAATIGYWGETRIGSAVPAVLAMAILPAVGAWFAGIRDPDQLLKIAAYGVGVFLLCYALRPRVAGRFPPGKPNPNDRVSAYMFVPSSLLAVIGAGFACRREEQ
ncbi:hypothetical protein [Aeoliella sp.]|uniref:hypothetical protein n=1 Tax=Aeoliella sp. TaxID=2795800 RepID=UPI003CCC304E